MMVFYRGNETSCRRLLLDQEQAFHSVQDFLSLIREPP
jgi:hypothetical protein